MRFDPAPERGGGGSAVSAAITATMLGRRAAALIVDGVIVGIALAPFLTLGPGADLFSRLCESSWSLRSALLVGTIFVVPFVTYEGALLHLTGRTLGKRLVCVRVVDRDGADLQGWQAWLRPLVRATFRWVSPINYAAALVTRDSRCVHDVLSRTRVVYVARSASARRDRQETRRLSEPQQWWFWAKWVALSVVGWTAGILLAEVATDSVFGASVRDGPLLFACTGLGTGAAQALLLYRHVARAWLWTLATILGSVIGAGLFDRVQAHLDTVSLTASLAVAWIPEIAAGLALNWTGGWCTRFDLGNQTMIDVAWASAPLGAAALVGATLGLAQWTVLRRAIARAAWWVVANAAAMAFIAVLTSEPPSRQRVLGIWLGLALIAFQTFVLRWRILGASSWVAASTLAGAYALGANEGDFTFAAVMSLVTGLAMTALVSQRRRLV